MAAFEAINGVSGKYSLFYFAFNPCSIYLESDTRDTLRIDIIDIIDGGIVIDREPVYSSVTGKYVTTFDLSGAFQGCFKQELGDIDISDSIMDITVHVKIKKVSTTGIETDIFDYYPHVFWGALQIGERLNNYKRLVYWPGKPFTFSVFFVFEGADHYNAFIRYIDKDTGLLHGYTQFYTGLYSGKYNLQLTADAMSNATGTIIVRFDRLLTAETWPGIFDKTFDHTFRRTDENTFFMKFEVAECVPDGVYLRWVDPQGRWLYYNFRIAGKSRSASDSSISIENQFNDIYSDNGRHEGTGGAIGKEGQDTINVFASMMDKDIFDYVWTLGISPMVYMLHTDSEGVETWVKVNISTGSFPRSNKHLQDLSFSVLLPKLMLPSL